ncbi:MAG: hypothetical protein C0524_03370 [Rhodobacter sp.]|nr:hypothetical protein [Rhodobacter sp.]
MTGPDMNPLPGSRHGQLRLALRWGLHRLAIYLGAMLVLAGLILVLPDAGLWITLSALSGLGLAATLWLLLPLPRMILLAPVIVAGLVIALERSNDQKIDLTMFPVTPTDLTMAVTTPTGVLISIGAPDWAFALVYLVPAAAGLGLAIVALVALRRRGLWSGLARFGVLAASAIVAAGALWGLYQVILRTTSTYLLAHQDRLEVWEPAGISTFSNEVGVLGFLVYAHDIESTDRDQFLTYAPGVPAPGRPQVLAAADVYILQEQMQNAPPPNIVILHAESTFDPNLVFRLDRQVTNPLFPTSPADTRPASAHLAVPALVDTVGGGSWTSEFEVLTGIDARLFGVAGRFTHSSLSPSANATFPRYLAALGYQLAAYTYSDGGFYNYRRGYLNYGFKEFYDIDFFAIPSTDAQIADTAMTLGTVATDAPFLKMILLNDNHSPHHCAPERAAEYETVAFEGEATEAMTCALQEYLWRSQNVARTVDLIEARLILLKETTGRDYVLAVYGDHQPYSFTGGGSAEHNMGLDFNAVRKDGEKRLTLVQIRSSRPNLLNCCGGAAMPLTLLPTLISAYVAPSLEDLYLPETLYQFDNCGSDWIGRLVTSSFYGKSGANDDQRCEAFPEIVAALQESNVMRRPDAGSRVGTAQAAPEVAKDANQFRCLDPEGNLVVELSVSGTKLGEPPLFAVRLDGVEVGRGAVDGAIDTAERSADPAEILSQPQTVQLKTRLAHIPRTIGVEFLNDNWAGEGKTGDTDLWLQSVQVGAVRLEAADFQPVDVISPPGIDYGTWYRFSRSGGLVGFLPSDFCR